MKTWSVKKLDCKHVVNSYSRNALRTLLLSLVVDLPHDWDPPPDSAGSSGREAAARPPSQTSSSSADGTVSANVAPAPLSSANLADQLRVAVESELADYEKDMEMSDDGVSSAVIPPVVLLAANLDKQKHLRQSRGGETKQKKRRKHLKE